MDNRKSNLRICTRSQNNANAQSKTGVSKYKGVYRSKSKKTRKDGSVHVWYRWCAEIKGNHKRIYIGRFINEDDAGRAYDKAAKELFGEYANLNFKS